MKNTVILPGTFEGEMILAFLKISNEPSRIKMSLRIITTVSHKGKPWNIVKAMNPAVVHTLSAKGSSIFPSSVIALNFLAKKPSRKSVTTATKINNSNSPVSDLEI